VTSQAKVKPQRIIRDRRAQRNATDEVEVGAADAPRAHPDEPDATSVEVAARAVGLSRSLLFLAMSQDPEKRRGLPFLAYVKAGKRRLIRTETRRAWLKQLEESAKSAALRRPRRIPARSGHAVQP
jgi:hypothetical protein